jgi:hypothetical protein
MIKSYALFNIQDLPQETNILYHEVWAKYGLRRSEKLCEEYQSIR